MEDFFRRFFFIPNFAFAFEEQRRLRAAAQHSSSGPRLCIHLAPQLSLRNRAGRKGAPLRAVQISI